MKAQHCGRTTTLVVLFAVVATCASLAVSATTASTDNVFQTATSAADESPEVLALLNERLQAELVATSTRLNEVEQRINVLMLAVGAGILVVGFITGWLIGYKLGRQRRWS